VAEPVVYDIPLPAGRHTFEVQPVDPSLSFSISMVPL
jgi:hypothetical protein